MPLLRRGSRCRARGSAVTRQVYIAPAKRPPPFDVEAVVLEQDVDLLLDTEPVVTRPRESMEALVEAVTTAKPKTPGTVLVAGAAVPYRFLAIVHDFTRDPSWTEAWVSSALDAVLRESEARRLAAIGVPLLGCVHGKLSAKRSLDLLCGSLERSRLEHLKRLWLLIPSLADRRLFDALRPSGWDLLYGGDPDVSVH